MRYLKQKEFGKVQAFELGWSPVGKPLMTVHFYIVDGLCIDTAIRHMRREALECARQHNIHTVILTHHHEDHSGNAACFKSEVGVPVYGHAATVEKMQQGFRILPYQHFAWGATQPLKMTEIPCAVESDSTKLQPIHTPGHSKDHIVFYEPSEGWLFSGDLFIAERIKYFRADEKMKDEIDSLKKVCELDFDTLFCAHNPKIQNGKQKLLNKLQFLEELHGSVSALHARGLGLNDIIREIGLKENYFMKLFCMGNVSMKNMVRSVLGT